MSAVKDLGGEITQNQAIIYIYSWVSSFLPGYQMLIRLRAMPV
ncbi:hypothetical protein [Polynucleobacter sp.]